MSGPTVAAFLGRTERGPVNEPVLLASFDDYRRMFGGHCAFSHVSYAVQHYFSHGGRRAIVVRLTNRATSSQIEVPADHETLRLKARRPGSREYLRVSIDYDRVEDDPARFNLVVQRLSRPGSQLVEDQELFPAVSIDSIDRRFVVDALQESQLISLLGPLPSRRPNATTARHPGQAIPYLDMARSGTDGDELTDYDLVGSNEEGTGLFALDRVARIDLVSIPPPPALDIGPTAFLAAERYCKRRRAMLIWDPPWSWRSVDAALHGMRATALTGRNAFTYFPRLRPRGGGDARHSGGLPASGALAGMLACGDADLAGQLSHARPLAVKGSLTTTVEVSDKEAAALARSGANALVRVQGGNVVLKGNVCLAPRDDVSTPWQRLDVERTALLVLDAVERGTEWARRDVDVPETRARLLHEVREFLAGLHEQGVLVGRRDEQAFFVRVADSRRGLGLTLKVGFALTKPGELLVYELDLCGGKARARAAAPLDSGHLVG